MRNWFQRTTPLFLALFFFLGVGVAGAQQVASPFLWLHWEAKSSVPDDYRGRALGTSFTPFVVRLDVVEGGRFRDLSQKVVRWYVNKNLVQQGAGLTELTLSPGKTISNSGYEVRVDLPDLVSGRTVSKIIFIPTVTPQVSLKLPFFKETKPGARFEVLAHPYFFSLNSDGSKREASFSWTLNSNTVFPEEGNPQQLKVNVSPQANTQFSGVLRTIVTGSKNKLERAEAQAVFTVR